jgi:hypothetical protein
MSLSQQRRHNRGASRNDPPVERIERRLANVERRVGNQIVNSKYIVQSVTGVNLLNSTPYVTCLNNVVQGTDETNRIGDIGKMKWLELGYDLVSQAIFVLGCYNARVMVVSETTSLGAAVSLAQLMTSATPSPYNMQNYTTRDDKRFKVWYDSGPMPIGPNGFTAPAVALQNTFGYPPRIQKGKIRIPLADLRVDYSRGNAGTVADIDTNALSLCVFTDQTTTNYLAFAFASVVKFVDS